MPKLHAMTDGAKVGDAPKVVMPPKVNSWPKVAFVVWYPKVVGLPSQGMVTLGCRRKLLVGKR
ncbi:MAG TPA: hypothetical protein VFT30_07310 [Nitrospira sp.]|nr:hypothetical protein [Nitrospira sp.]